MTDRKHPPNAEATQQSPSGMSDREIAEQCRELENAPPPRSTTSELGASDPDKPVSRMPWIVGVGLVLILIEMVIMVQMRPTSPQLPAMTEGEKRQAATARSAGDLIVVQTAVEHHKKTTGAYPGSIEEVLPVLPPPLASDFRTGGSSYHTDGDGFSVRSSTGPIALELSSDTKAPVAVKEES